MNDGVDIHFFERHTAILGALERNALELAYQYFSIGAAVRFYETDYDVEALSLQQVCLFEHLIGLADARRSAKIYAQSRAASLLLLGEQ
jgi:hypothetical protein